MKQTIISGKDSHTQIKGLLEGVGARKFMLVCGASFSYLSIQSYFDTIDLPYVSFSAFTANPHYEDVVKGVALFNAEHCDSILAVGGGSSIDVAKCIKLFSTMDPARNYLEQEFIANDVPLFALPTTAGSGSEATRYAVVYYEGVKQSITHKSLIPDYAILDPSVLKTLPIYQKKCAMLDALCQSMEAWWSLNSTEESITYSKIAIENILTYKDEYLANCSDISCERILLAANFAGRAINIAQTTAPHAMSYILTSKYKIPHGHAVAICLPKIWAHMASHLDDCIDPRGLDYLGQVFRAIADAFHATDVQDAIRKFETILDELDIHSNGIVQYDDIDFLTKSVNPTRLGNNPVHLEETVLRDIYRSFLEKNNDITTEKGTLL